MGKIVMPKNSALLNELEAVLKIYYEETDWLSNDVYKERLKNIIGTDQYSSSYTKKAQIPVYFGFVEWETPNNKQSRKRITPSGVKFYEAICNENADEKLNILMEAMETVIFGRNNCGVGDSDSDVEIPPLFIRAALDLDYLTYNEFAYLVWSIADKNEYYESAVLSIKKMRVLNNFTLPSEAGNYADAKPIMALLRWGFLQETESTARNMKMTVSNRAMELFGERLYDLKIYNTEKHFNPKQIIVTTTEYNNVIGENLLIYGVPGCGKSHYIKEKYILNEQNSERVVFHPDYTYSDFVGQILPKVHSKDGGNADDNTISYDFIAGPFTRLLAKCEENDGMQYLVIEEINRGNAPAIFGEIFQLLDRTATGESEYGISNEDISSEVYGDRTQQVKIPNNLTILATMNTADQNVFTLDTAFKRRWKMKAIRNNFDDTEHKNQCTTPLCRTQLEWGKFAKAINNKIIQAAQENLGSEDKRLGIYFLKDTEMNSYEIFSEKVLMYLWNDVFKLDTTQIFKDRYRTLEDVLDDFAKEDIRFKVFVPELGFDSYIIDKTETATVGDADGE